jgi:Pvc16 N-terminal domain
MLNLLDESMERFLRAVVPLTPRETDIAFEAPDKDWAVSASSRPTVNLYLWDIRPSLVERDFGMIEVTDGNGQRQRRGPLPRVECRFLVTAWTTHVGDEHALLGRVLSALLVNQVIAEEHLAGALASIKPWPTIELRTGTAAENSDFWTALGGQLKPGLDVVVTVTVDAAIMSKAGPPTREVLLEQSIREGSADEATVVDERHTIADETHYRPEDRPPGESSAAGPAELAARMRDAKP